MAREFRSYTLAIPASTPSTAPVLQKMTMPERRIDALEIVVPPGPSGLVGFCLLVGGVRFIPYDSDPWIITAGETINWPTDNLPTSGDWSAAGYNTGANPHSVYFRFLCSLVSDPAEPAPIAFDVSTVNAMAPTQ